MRPLAALIVIASLAAVPAGAQSAPGYTFGPTFGSGVNGGMPGLYPGGMNGYNGKQSPFLTMPLYPGSGIQAPLGGTIPPTGQAQAQPLPYWMQTPQPMRPPPARFIEAPVTAHTRQPHQAPAISPNHPPRWAPLSGPLPSISHHAPSGNNWRIGPQATPEPSTPSKWHSE